MDRTEELLRAIERAAPSMPFLDMSPLEQKIEAIQAEVEALKAPKQYQMEHQRNGRGELDRTIITEIDA